jgi:hypothetical protein
MVVRLSALRAGRLLPPGKYLVLICWRLSRPQGHSAAGRIRPIEKSSDLIGNRTRDLPNCSVVPQPTTLPHAPDTLHISRNQVSYLFPFCSYFFFIFFLIYRKFLNYSLQIFLSRGTLTRQNIYHICLWFSLLILFTEVKPWKICTY